MKEIPLTRGFVAFVDDEDFDRLSQHRWIAAGGAGRRTPYAQRYVWRKDPDGEWRKAIVHMHREVSGCEEGQVVDHVDLNGLNNRRSNLRTCTLSQNMGNAAKRSDNSSGFKGVYCLARQVGPRPFRASIRIQGKTKHLGCFATAEEAAQAYDLKAREVFGEFARLNFPQDGELAA